MVLKIFICPSRIANWSLGLLEWGAIAIQSEPWGFSIANSEHNLEINNN